MTLGESYFYISWNKTNHDSFLTIYEIKCLLVTGFDFYSNEQSTTTKIDIFAVVPKAPEHQEFYVVVYINI